MSGSRRIYVSCARSAITCQHTIWLDSRRLKSHLWTNVNTFHSSCCFLWYELIYLNLNNKRRRRRLSDQRSSDKTKLITNHLKWSHTQPRAIIEKNPSRNWNNINNSLALRTYVPYYYLWSGRGDMDLWYLQPRYTISIEEPIPHESLGR